MSRRADRSLFVRLLKLAMWVSLAAALVQLLVALFRWRMSGLPAQLLLTCMCVFLGAMFMYVQLRARHRAGPGFALLLMFGTAAVVASQISFLALVWANWATTMTFTWRLWWVTMVMSVVITHLVMLQAASARRGGPVELITAVMAVWTGLMVLWLGLRGDMLADISPAYLWVLVFPATLTAVGSVYLMVRRVLGVARPGSISKGAAVTGVLMSHLAVAVVAFFVGRAGAEHGQRPGPQPGTLVASAGGDVARHLGKTAYAVQSGVAEYLGDTRIVTRAPFITPAQIEAIEPRLQPGDILLERRNWYLSNPFLPGFWPHAALYVGRLEDLKRLGIADNPAVQRHLADYLRAAPDGRAKTVIEAVSEGVLLNSLTHSMHADYVAVLRPRVGSRQIATAIVRAFANLGKPYDFNFDFEDTAKLVCSQVVYLSYADVLDFPLQRVLGRTTMPSNEIARKYANEAGKADRQLDFVLFLDAVPSRGVAAESTAAEFRKSVQRPRVLVETP